MKLMIRKMTDQDPEPLCVLLSDPDAMQYPEPPYGDEDNLLNITGPQWFFRR